MSRARSVLAAVCALGLALTINACANAYDGAQQARGAISRAIDESTQAWVRYDHDKQIKIASYAPTQADAKAALEIYRQGEQAKVIKALNGCWAALVGLDKALAMWSAGQKAGLQGALVTAYAALSDVAQALTLLGIPIPGRI